jgi:hypothetical protein
MSEPNVSPPSTVVTELTRHSSTKFEPVLTRPWTVGESANFEGHVRYTAHFLSTLETTAASLAFACNGYPVALDFSRFVSRVVQPPLPRATSGALCSSNPGIDRRHQLSMPHLARRALTDIKISLGCADSLLHHDISSPSSLSSACSRQHSGH